MSKYHFNIYNKSNSISNLDSFLIKNQAYPQQSPAYLNFYKKTEDDAWIITCEDKTGTIIVSSLIVKHSRKLPLKMTMSYLFSVYGPVINKDVDKKTLNTAWAEYLKYLKKFTKGQKSLYLKFYPNLTEDENGHCSLMLTGLIPSTGPQRPKETSILDLTQFKDSKDYLSMIKPKWRYNIKLAERKGIEIQFSKDIKYINDFYRLTNTTGKRQDFSPWPKKKYKGLSEALFKENIGEWGIAQYKGKVLGIILIIKYGKLGIYLKGASSNEHRNLMPNHLLHFKTIDRLKKEGYEKYDLFGVSTNPEDPLHGGITDFKLGFLPKDLATDRKITRWEKPYDLVTNPLIYKILKRLKRN